MRFALSAIAAAMFATGQLTAQTGRPIELRSAQQLNVHTVAGEEVRDFVGNVHFVQPSEKGGLVQLWCDRAQQYTRQGRIELFGNVRIVQDSVTLTGRQGTYFNKTRSARMLAGVRLHRDDMVLTALQGHYDADSKQAWFYGDVHVVDSVSTTRCDTLTYFQEGDRSIAVGRVMVFSPGDGVTVYGDSLAHFGDIEYTIVPRNPKMVHVDTVSVGRIDTLVVTGQVMESYRDTSARYVVRDSVQLVRNELAARCGHILYKPREGIAALTRQPVVWYEENQITGDSIAVTLEQNRLRRVFVAGRAMAVSRSDSAFAHRFDQLTGRSLTLYFGNENLQRIEAVRNATSLYYLFDGLNPNGVNRSSGDTIVVNFAEGQVEEITVRGGVEGTYRPENLIVTKEPTLNLDGFRWYGNRPRRTGIEIVAE